MKSEIRIKDEASVCYIEIEGTIGVPEEWQFDEPEERVATYEKFRQTVARIGGMKTPSIVVNIRSTGGDVNDALLIHDALRQTGAHITTRCYGYTASAATIIAQAATEGCREISANALYLIHNAVCSTEGNASELRSKCQLLEQTDARIARIYATRSGHAVEEFTALMGANDGNGRWLSPEEAVEAALADRVIDTEEQPANRSVVRNLSRGWRRLLDTMGITPESRPVAGCNVLHFDTPVDTAVESRRNMLHPTRTLACEDPSCNDPLRSANERAYSEDVRSFRM